MKKEELRKLIPKDVLDQCGCVLLSSVRTVRAGPLLWVGFNPGGDPCDEKWPTLARSIELDKPWFVDGLGNDRGWANRSARQMQRAMKILAELHGCEVHDVCAMNLAFRRTKTASEVTEADLEQSWNVVQAIISIVRPRTIVCNGRETHYRLCASIGNAAWLDPIRHGKRWFISVAEAGGMLTLGFPHFSRWGLDNRRTALDVLRRMLPHK